MPTKEDLLGVQDDALSRIETQKKELEFSRYKQDCRKRALEMAHLELARLLSQEKGAEFNVTQAADKYYNWLISIP